MRTVTNNSPDFTQLLKVLRRDIPDRPVLFEFFFDDEVYEELTGKKLSEGTRWPNLNNLYERGKIIIEAFMKAGYDHATIQGSAFDIMYNVFKNKTVESATVSLNEGNYIFDRKSFENFPWCEPEDFDYSHLDSLAEVLPEGMKLIVQGPCGILEMVIQLIGYEKLCYLFFDDPELTKEVFDAVGTRFVRYYQQVVRHKSVGAIIYNDDWGFNTGPMISPDHLRSLVFPHVRRIVSCAHSAGLPAILHSCGNLYHQLIEDIIDDLKFDAKHSFEDIILPVEEAYRHYHQRIAILGGLDVDFLVRSSPQQIEERSKKLLELGMHGGAYALGSGNSIANYIPQASFRAIRSAAGKL